MAVFLLWDPFGSLLEIPVSERIPSLFVEHPTFFLNEASHFQTAHGCVGGILDPLARQPALFRAGKDSADEEVFSVFGFLGSWVAFAGGGIPGARERSFSRKTRQLP
ncbi:hypothetical protein ABH19_04040 [Leptospirillum sp. Group II 'CF-1']|jgi:hypothetical protein|nr:hypothetical protein ABH19_04040 [Leptospirillum sp. Group II 'CF-1']